MSTNTLPSHIEHLMSRARAVIAADYEHFYPETNIEAAPEEATSQVCATCRSKT